MPIYTYKCRKCNCTTEEHRSYSECDVNMPVCCDQTTFIQIQPPMMVQIDNLSSYVCPVTDQVVTSSKQKREIEAKHDLVIKEPGIVKKRKPEPMPEIPAAVQAEMKNIDKYMPDIPI